MKNLTFLLVCSVLFFSCDVGHQIKVNTDLRVIIVQGVDAQSLELTFQATIAPSDTPTVYIWYGDASKYLPSQTTTENGSLNGVIVFPATNQSAILYGFWRDDHRSIIIHP